MTDRLPVIALVDDDPRLLDSLGNLLESVGCSVHKFPSASALLAHDLGTVDLLITDVGMPRMDGFELRQLLSVQHPRLPVLLISGRHEIAEQARAQGDSTIFRKPFDTPVLLTAIDNILKAREEGR